MPDVEEKSDKSLKNFGESTSRFDLSALTVRERSILTLLAKGLPNKLIAYNLCIAEATVKTHSRSLLKKMNARNRTEAAALFLSGKQATTVGSADFAENKESNIRARDMENKIDEILARIENGISQQSNLMKDLNNKLR